MRNRLVALLVGTTLAVVLLYGIPRAYFLADLVQGYESSATERSADLVAAVVTEHQDAPLVVTEEFLEPLLHTGESIEYAAADGTVLRAGLPSARDDPDDIRVTRVLPDGSDVTVRRSAALVGDHVSDALLPLIGIGLGLIVISAVVARLLAERLSRPFLELAAVADAVGHGRFDVVVPRYRVAEADAIGEALRRGSARLDELVRRERDVAANASHELRSPISALRMGIEDLASWPQTPADVSAELRSYLPQLDRLNSAVRQYLDRAQDQRLTDVDVVDLSRLVDDAADRWRHRIQASDPDHALIQVDQSRRPLLVRASASTVEEILDLILQGALDRQASHVCVEVDATGDYGRVRLRTLRASPVRADQHALTAAARTAASLGGRLSTREGEGDTVVVMLPCAG